MCGSFEQKIACLESRRMVITLAPKCKHIYCRVINRNQAIPPQGNAYATRCLPPAARPARGPPKKYKLRELFWQVVLIMIGASSTAYSLLGKIPCPKIRRGENTLALSVFSF